MNGDLKLELTKSLTWVHPPPADATTKAYVDVFAFMDNISNLKIFENEPAGGDIFAYPGAKKLFIDPPVDSAVMEMILKLVMLFKIHWWYI